MKIYAGYSEKRKKIIEFTEEEKNQILVCLKKIEEHHGFGEDMHTGINSYDNDDYLFLCKMVAEAYSVYNRMNISPETGEFRNGYKRIPYIHAELTSDFVLYDKYLNASVKKIKDIYWLHFNKYKFEKCILFLQLIFDKNKEITTELKNQKVQYADHTYGIASDTFEKEELVTKNKIIEQAYILKSMGLSDLSENMKQYALSLNENDKVHMPAIVFVNAGTKDQIVDVIYYDSDRKALTVPLKKKIFNTSGFNKWFIRRNELIQRVFEESMQFIISHEFAHIANGHCDLKKEDLENCKKREIALCAELNADDTAVRWRMFDLLFHGQDGNPQNQYLAYTREELKEEWAIRGFSAYFAMSWCYREDERKWDESTLEEFIRDERQTHPIYQFRTFSILNRVLCSLENIIITEDTELLRTSDGVALDKALIEETEDEIMDMVYSFEKYFDETYNENRSIMEWLKESGKVEEKSIPDDYHKVPFLMPVYLERANSEMKKMADTWKELQERLEKNGTYCKLYRKMLD